MENTITTLNEINELRQAKRDDVFSRYPDPKCKERNTWRSYTRMLANIKDDGFLGGESGVQVSTLDKALTFFRNI